MSLVQPNTHRAILIDLFWVGQDNVQETRFWTSWPEPLTADLQPYESKPFLEVDIPTYKSGWERESAEIAMSSVEQLSRETTLGRAFPIISVRIKQLSWDPRDFTTATVLTMWRGELVASELNPEGREGVTVAQIDSCGGETDSTVNPITSARCWKRFGDAKTCKFPRASVTETGTVTNINGLTLTMTGLNPPEIINYYVNGDVILDGAVIKIRSWSRSDPTIFELAEYPPSTFADRVLPVVVDVRPGCDHSQLACSGYGNEINWGGGLGAAQPTREPSTELR